MPKKDVPPVNGKFKIKDKYNRNVELEFVNSSDTDKHIVEEKTDADVTEKLPSPRPQWNNQDIDWFVNFSVYIKKQDGQKGDPANVKYYITMNLEEGKLLFFYYGGQLHNVTDEFRRNRRVELSAGDPPGGSWP